MLSDNTLFHSRLQQNLVNWINQNIDRYEAMGIGIILAFQQDFAENSKNAVRTKSSDCILHINTHN
jgi:hypothetical protein